MNIKDEIFEAYGEMKAEHDLLAVGYTALLGTSMAAKSGEAALLNRFSARYVRECQNLYEKWNGSVQNLPASAGSISPGEPRPNRKYSVLRRRSG